MKAALSLVKRYFRRRKLERCRAKQPYIYFFQGLEIIVEKDVFPPDIGLATAEFIKLLPKYEAQTALDVGSGTGLIAFAMKKRGVPTVYAVDNHLPAIACIEKNRERNERYKDITVLTSDLFANVPGDITFDLVIFNHPYSPATNTIIFGNGSDGGPAIVERFLKDAKNYLTDDGVILMSFSDTFSEQYDPVYIALENGYTSKVVKEKSSLIDTVRIYEFRLPCQ